MSAWEEPANPDPFIAPLWQDLGVLRSAGFLSEGVRSLSGGSMEPMTNAGLSPNEAIVSRITIDSSRCAGCRKTGTDFMLTGIVGEDPRRDGRATFYDLFLSRTQVEALHAQIGALLGKVEKGPTT